MRYFLDTEFNQTIEPIQLISIGIVREDEKEFYAELEFDAMRVDDWLRANVLPHLGQCHTTRTGLSVPQCRKMVEEFTRDDPSCEFWGYYADYDWYLLTRMWGFVNMPKNFPKLCFDLKQTQHHLPGLVFLPPLQPEHHALVDARWAKRAYDEAVWYLDRRSRRFEI